MHSLRIAPGKYADMLPPKKSEFIYRPEDFEVALGKRKTAA
jgi:hypothetical protein